MIDEFQTVFDHPRFPHGPAHCPECDAGVLVALDCPGVQRDGAVLIHSNCQEALRFDCEDDCGWWYLDPVGLRDNEPMGRAPAWIAWSMVE